jgi:hypothetical protein
MHQWREPIIDREWSEEPLGILVGKPERSLWGGIVFPYLHSYKEGSYLVVGDHLLGEEISRSVKC